MGALIKRPVKRIIEPITTFPGGEVELGFKATDIPGNVLWLDSLGLTNVSLDGNGRGITWFDRSGFGNDAQQPLFFRRPLYIPATLSNISGFLFDFQDDEHLEIANSSSLQWANEASFFFVYNITIGSQFGIFIHKGDPPTAGLIDWGSLAKVSLSGNGLKITSNAGLTEGINRILTITKGAGTRRLRVDGVNQINQFFDTDLLNNSGVLTIGGATGGGAGFDGVMSSVAIYNRVLTNDEVDEAEAGFADRYRITI